MRVGDRVDFWEGSPTQDQPYAGIITYVLGPSTVSLVAFDTSGFPRGFTAVVVTPRVEIKDSQGRVIGYNRCCQLV